MSNLKTVELKAFVPSRDFERSKQFYTEIGFTKKSDAGGVAYFSCGNSSFLLQDFYEQSLAENLMMHLLVEDVDAWHRRISASGVSSKFGSKISELTEQPWRMRDFVVSDPCGVQWRIGQNI